MSTKRLFVAVPFHDSVRDGLVRLQEEAAEQTDRRHARWIPKDNLHVTLHFLGDTEETRVGALREALDETATSAGPIEVSIASVGCFPHPRRPRVLWAGFDEGSDELIGLAERLQAALKARGFPPPDKEFHPHLTLAYVRKKTRPPEARMLPPAMEKAAESVLGSGLRDSVSEMVLYESTLSPKGATYTRLHSSPLGQVAQE